LSFVLYQIFFPTSQIVPVVELRAYKVLMIFRTLQFGRKTWTLESVVFFWWNRHQVRWNERIVSTRLTMWSIILVLFSMAVFVDFFKEEKSENPSPFQNRSVLFPL